MSAPVQTVLVASTQGWELPGELRTPSESNGKSILLLHQLRRDRHTFDALANDLSERGFTVLAVDARGHGKSTQNGKAGKSWELFDENAGEFLGLIDDAQRALDFLRAATPTNNIIVAGSSVGGNCAVLLAAKPANKVSGILLLSAGFNYKKVDCRAAVEKVKCPAFIAASAEDSYAHHCCQKMSETIPDSVFVDLKDAGHGTDMLRYEGLHAKLVEWLDKQ